MIMLQLRCASVKLKFLPDGMNTATRHKSYINDIQIVVSVLHSPSTSLSHSSAMGDC